jgi:2-oxoglutarate dehydrogenase complex dehydrogenase (E1) component-like enzyme
MESVLRKVGLIEKSRVHYIGRRSSSTSATGYGDVHAKELEKFLKEAFN